MTNLLDFDPKALAEHWGSPGDKPSAVRMRAQQVTRWMHRGLVDDFAGMTDVAKSLRERLGREAEIRAPAIVRDAVASDGTRKWLFDVGGANAVEAVFIPEDD